MYGLPILHREMTAWKPGYPGYGREISIYSTRTRCRLRERERSSLSLREWRACVVTLSRPCARRLARARPHPAVFPRVHPKLHGRFRLEPDFRGTRVSREGGNTARFLFSSPRWLCMVYRMEPPNQFSRFRTDSRKHFVGRGVTGPLVWFGCHGCTQELH